jgi:phosphatidylglycerol:prolipoprotein diacylglycerol transferase
VIPEFEEQCRRLKTGEFWVLVYSLFFGALLGGKLGFFVVEWKEFRDDPAWLLAHWQTGWVFWFGFAGAILAGLIFLSIYNRLYMPRKFIFLADYFAAAVPLGHWIGRLGCLAEGCCHGRPTMMPWGVVFRDPTSSVSQEFLGVALHPTQLYEAVGEIAIGAFLLKQVLPRLRCGELKAGTAFYGYILFYSLLRFIVEFFRGDDRGVLLCPALSPSQWVSLVGLLTAGFFLWHPIEPRPRQLV